MLTLLLLIAQLSSTVGGIFVLARYHMHIDIFLTSFIPVSRPLRLSDAVFFILVLLQCGITFYLWITLTFAGSTFFTFINWSRQLLRRLASFNVKERSNADFFFLISCYKHFQIAVLLLNEIVGDHLTVLAGNSLTVFCVASLTLYIKYHQELNMQMIFASLTVMIAGLASLFQLYYLDGDINHASKILIAKINRSVKQARIGRQDRILVKMYVKSLVPLRVRMGSFGYFKKRTAIA